MTRAGNAGSRGAPLIVIALLLTAWTGARAIWWENPFAVIADVIGQPPANAAAPQLAEVFASGVPTVAAAQPLSVAAFGLREANLAGAGAAEKIDPQTAAARQFIWFAALRETLAHASGADRHAAAFTPELFAAPEPPPYLPAPAAVPGGRWSLDAWAFWRQGSDSAPISQGRVPIYGASQAGAVLQYRLAPDTRRDPRIYARAYRALVPRGESELALGASFRPVPRVPVRVAGEARYADTAFGNDVRPAAYAVTELAPIALPFGAQLEAYGQAGWVGGASATVFADGQASVTREVRAIARANDDAVRLSIGAAGWGGAQRDAQRVDIGPTIRLDLTLGDVPVRLSVDWRERVGGQASPGSGLAATFSTRF